MTSASRPSKRPQSPLARPSAQHLAKEAQYGKIPAAKRPRTVVTAGQQAPTRVATPDELEPGTLILYWDGWRGQIRDAFHPLDQFWVTDEESGDIVRDEDGNIVEFKAHELQIPAPLGSLGAAMGGEGPCGGVLLLGTEAHMTRILSHFGTPPVNGRQNPQQILAIPCNWCDPDKLQQTFASAVEESVVEFARTQRQDIDVAVRTFHLRQAVLQLGEDLQKLEDYFLLASVQVPFGWQEIESKVSQHVRYLRQEVWNQVDVCISANGAGSAEDTQEVVSQRALGETCGVEVSDVLWDSQVQAGLRRALDVPSLPLQFTDACAALVSVVMLPADATITTIKGVLCFGEAPGVDYTAQALSGRAGAAADAAEEAEADAELAGRPPARSAKAPPAKSDSGAGGAGRAPQGGAAQVHGKTIQEWESEQDEFAGPKLPPNWLRIKSRTDGRVYYFNKKTQQSTFELPLPDGWTKHVSNSTGKTYYFHAGRRASTFERPTE